MKKKRITAIQAYWKGVRCAEHLIRGLKQMSEHDPDASPSLIANAIYVLTYYATGRVCLRLMPIYFRMLGMEVPRPIRHLPSSSDENLTTSFRVGLFVGLEEILDNSDTMIEQTEEF